ncbi:transcriptional repressor [Gordonia phage Catfish]|uniref:Immunity repressor n=1 Tax=Gordonia phage Catfish TaxID=2301538 RepID=A0A385D0X1_9CAUD|nr:transcriptional repressor [Gordonia phage Catfish]AXQ51875.1 immunity repressor [Gordonia phage Catfish]
MERLNRYLKSAIGRPATREELAIAVGVSVSTIDRRRGEGFTLDEVLSVAEYFELSKVETLLAYGAIELEDVLRNADADGAMVATTSTAALAAEVARRLAEGEGATAGKAPRGIAPRNTDETDSDTPRRVGDRRRPTAASVRQGIFQ